MTSRDERRLPPFASGRLVDNYRVLFEYWRLARERGREDLVEKAMLSDNDYKLLASLVESEGKIRATDLIEVLADKLTDRIDDDIAILALEKAGYRLSKEDAKRYIARLLAAWLVEAGEYWRIIKLS